MSPEKAVKLELKMEQIPHKIKVFNVDGTPNKTAWITQSVTAKYVIGTKKMTNTFLISGLGKEEIILGLPWLRKYNPDIPQVRGVLDFIPPMESLRRVDIRAKLSASQRLEHGITRSVKDTSATIPTYLEEYQEQFEDKAAERFPVSRSYDHAIELKPEFTPRDCKIYSLTALEQTELDDFLHENLWKGYIQKLKSPIASLFFFVGKKEKGKLRPTQDYRWLNHGTDTTIFLKLDLRNGYNNIQIKDGDQWKATFKTN
ncbi:hypothetical protein Moror_15158 [Moniliophthora roreri MCA 2997]|uniref:Reverse transcriptase-rnase h-integrase n=1 Tax=Moniliophthora roreri (strain MCA 2997) TaxID=1381753 RepID=V2X2V0_MONRO|nr:hypothetical protein Moror_15158 [Moniliophthora roreri MCA 2997]